jgi:hypothetical protein
MLAIKAARDEKAGVGNMAQVNATEIGTPSRIAERAAVIVRLDRNRRY